MEVPRWRRPEMGVEVYVERSLRWNSTVRERTLAVLTQKARGHAGKSVGGEGEARGWNFVIQYALKISNPGGPG